ARPPGKEDHRGPRRAGEIQDRFRRRRRRPVRFGLGLVVGEERQAGNLQDAQRRKPAGAWRHADPRRRRLGALLLHRLSQSPSGLSEGVCRSSGELGVCRPAVLEGLILGNESWGGSIELPPFRLLRRFLILAGIASLRQNLTEKLVMPGIVPG